MNRRMIASCLAAATVLSAAFSMISCSGAARAEGECEAVNTMTGLDFARELKLGWNLGNTFDAPEGEMSWGNPMTTKELLELVKELGFNTIRIPISWRMHVTPAPDYTIDESFMKRIDTVVNQALDAGLYVIINSHHDNEIYTPKPENSERGKAYLAAVWAQVADHFKDADYHLIFETMNEPRVVGSSYEWGIDTSNPNSMAAVQVVNELNQVALDAIRSTGSKNADRFVIISAYAGNVDAALSPKFVLPQDSVEDKLIVSIHAYSPYNFALNINSKDASFGKMKEKEIASLMRNINYRLVNKGIPVVIDEMGALNKNNDEDRYEWAKCYVSAAAQYGIPCIWWDNGMINSSGENFGLINRRTLSIYPESERVYQGLLDGLNVEN